MRPPATGPGTDAVFGPHRARITSDEELRDAIPYLLGFAPERSLVVLGLDADDQLAVAARVDATADAAAMRTTMRHIAEVLRRAGATHALLVYADDVDPVETEGSIVRATAFVAAARHLADVRDLEPVLRSELSAAGLPAAFRWPDPSDLMRSSGSVPPDAALAEIVNGRAVVRRRSDLVAMLLPTGGSESADVADAVEELESVGIDRPATTDAVLGVLQRCSAGRRAGHPGGPLCAAEVAACAVAVADLGVRDVVVSMLGSDSQLVCDSIWLQVVRQAPERLVAGPATVLGVGAYLRGDGAFAGCAFDRALQADSGYRLALMMQRALEHGIPPAAIREFLAGILPDMLEVLSG